MSRALRLRQYETTRLPLTSIEVGRLRGLGAGLSIRPTEIEGQWDVRPQASAGTARVGDIQLIIEPKVGVTRLVELLGFARRLPCFGTSVDGARADGLSAVLAAMFGSALRRLLGRGLVRDYRHREEACTAVRGRVDLLALQTRRFGLVPPIDCAFDEFDVDVEANRRLLAACHLLSRLNAGTRVAGELRGLAGRFGGVSRLHYIASRVRPLHRDRRLARYDPALSLAELALSRAMVESIDGQIRSVSFMVNMDRLYEDVVAEGLRRELRLPPNRVRRAPRGYYLDRGKKVGLQPDVVIMDGRGRPRVVVDAKYKMAAGHLREDVYQVHAYCSAMGVETGFLVYADAPPLDLDVRRAPMSIRQRRLEIGSEQSLGAALRALATEVRAAISR